MLLWAQSSACDSRSGRAAFDSGDGGDGDASQRPFSDPEVLRALRELDPLARERLDSGGELRAVTALYLIFQRALGVFQWPS